MTPWIVARQVSLSVGFPQARVLKGVPFSSPADLPDWGIELASPALADRFFTTETPGKPEIVNSNLYTWHRVQIHFTVPHPSFSQIIGVWSHSDFSRELRLSSPGEASGNPLQHSCLENPRNRGAWWAVVCGVAQSRTRLKRLSCRSSSKLSSPMMTYVGQAWPPLGSWVLGGEACQTPFPATSVNRWRAALS